MVKKKTTALIAITQYAKDCINKEKEIYPLIYYCSYKKAGCHTASNCPYYNIKYIEPLKQKEVE